MKIENYNSRKFYNTGCRSDRVSVRTFVSNISQFDISDLKKIYLVNLYIGREKIPFLVKSKWSSLSQWARRVNAEDSKGARNKSLVSKMSLCSKAYLSIPCWHFVLDKLGARYLMGVKLKVVCAEFSTLSWAVLVDTSC
jgi:hypothetical protein